MKNLLLSLFAVALSAATIFAQAPEKMNYQGVARDLSGNVLANDAISLRLTIRAVSGSGSIVYRETHSVTTNAFGLFAIQIGTGANVVGTFSSITWGINPYYLETEIDPAGGTSYVSLGAQQLVSVPYALNAKSSFRTTAVSGSTNYIAKFTTDGTTIGNSTLYDDGTYVGIGTIAPQWNLQVNSPSVESVLQLSAQSTTGAGDLDGLLLGVNSSGAHLSLMENMKLSFGTNSTERMRITADGYVGIGTTSPTNFVHFHGPSSSAIQFTNPATGTGATDGIQLGIGLVSSYFINYEATDFSIGNNNNSGQIYIKANGYMGIGTTSPTRKLHVVDGAAAATAMYAENTYVGNSDGTGVTGKSRNNGYYGTGVTGEGGYIGVSGYGNGGSATQSVFAVYGYADGSAGTRYGVYGTANGGTTNYGVYCSGNGGYTGTWTQISDEKFKTDVTPLNSALALVNQLNPVSYQLKTKEFPMMNFPEARQYGFIAQELEQVIPLLVENGSHPGATKEDQDIKLKAVNYIGMIPVLTKAMQEQNELIKTLQRRIEVLEGK